MAQQISDAELEIMKIVWGNPDEVTLFPYIMDELAKKGQGQALSEEHPDRAAVEADEQGLSRRQENRTPQRIYRACLRGGVPDGADEELPG